MLTPKFKITQEDSHILLTLHIPYVKISTSEMFIEGTEFKFYLKPYYLRLNFNQELVEDGSESANYDVESGDITIKIPKKIPGEHFTDLAMITKLLAPKQTNPTPSKIEVLSSDSNLQIPDDFEWEWDQQVVENTIDTAVRYGFANSHSGVYSRFLGEYPDLVDLPDPDTNQPEERLLMMLEDLQRRFDMEHYLNDFLGPNEYVGDVISTPFIPPSLDNEQELLVELTKTSITPVLKSQMPQIMIGLFDLLFAYLFELRHTQGRETVESAWSISKLSTQFSWLSTGPTLHSAAILSITRALTFPLYRNFELCSKVLGDLKEVVSGGKSTILSTLLGLYNTLRSHEFYYLHNVVFVKEYCVWLQHVSDKHITKLQSALMEMKVTKSDLPLPLKQFEKLMELGEEASDSGEESSSGDEYTSSSSSELSTSSESEEKTDDLVDEGADSEMEALAVTVKSLDLDKIKPTTCLIEELN